VDIGWVKVHPHLYSTWQSSQIIAERGLPRGRWTSRHGAHAGPSFGFGRCHNSLPPNKGNELEDDDEMVQKSGIVEESHIHTTT
jgi:hypothetical protein